MNNEEYKKGLDLYENLVEEYINEKVHHLIKEEKDINNMDYLLKRLSESLYDSNLNNFAFKAFDDISLNTKEDYSIYVLMDCKKDYKIYKNLETLTIIKIYNDNNQKFIEENNVILPLYIDSSLAFFNRIRNDFFRILTNNSEQESIKKILKKRK